MRRLSHLLIYTALNAFAALFVLGAIVLRPMHHYDAPHYERVYWRTVTVALIVLVSCVIRFAPLHGARSVLMRLVRWRSPAWPGVVATALITAVMGTYPRYGWMTGTGSGGTAPLSKVEADVIQFLWQPMLLQMEADDVTLQLILAIVALTWACVGTLAGIVAMLPFRRSGVSLPLVVIITVAGVWCFLKVLLVLSPLSMPN